ncbi:MULTISPECIES: S1C family serine protease [Dehalococcoides]|jgi:S1-C subfamily serine protease|uniref:Serine protease n=2 Tax=Dehalococcoides mccartyi TaxID=61435 RepID=A0A142VC06_9CHLR|nr:MULTISPECIES: trypsin-like peptidase domain-containing protein [Dehalococcoides]AGG06574.1 serine protease, DegP-HtrA family [Dehalococcoides mccartyi DCMB5]AII61080.1 serine protease [Dehalococcoides mccartyi CG5]AMU86765.1 serine protease [Dehalococcoides mccartyi]AOV99554.1 serine protease [Dehalococcoides mccartyi]AQX75336.1 serine protease [Dehalococcoides mccartyi]
MKKLFKNFFGLFISISLVLSMLLAQGCDILQDFSNSPEDNTQNQTNTQNLPDQSDEIGSVPSPVNFVNAVKAVKPSVVSINVELVTRDIFGRTIVEQAAGSGWIIDSNGIIVTNNHVVEDATSITVTLDDGRTFNSVAVRTYPANDLAVIKINATNLPAVKLGDASKLAVGEPVAAIGNALGMGISMTGGWVSRLNTTVEFSDTESLTGLIETDAAINPGNSGGPLVNYQGEVIGITSAKIQEVGVEGIGYAISLYIALPIINNLISQLPA